MVLGPRNLVGTSTLAKEEANEVQTQQKRLKKQKQNECNIQHSNIYKNSNITLLLYLIQFGELKRKNCFSGCVCFFV